MEEVVRGSANCHALKPGQALTLGLRTYKVPGFSDFKGGELDCRNKMRRAQSIPAKQLMSVRYFWRRRFALPFEMRWGTSRLHNGLGEWFELDLPASGNSGKG